MPIGTAPVLVPQMSYTMQPVVQQVVTMQAVPTVSYGLAVAPTGVAPVSPVGVSTCPTAPTGTCGSGPTGAGPQGFGLADAELLLRLLAVARNAINPNQPPAVPNPAAGLTVAELDAHIRKLEADLAKTGMLVIRHDGRITAVEGKAAGTEEQLDKLLKAIQASEQYKDLKVNAPK
jgi:hypothetical protein